MWMPKPTKPEELYEFFIRGLPLKPTNRNLSIRSYTRKGWNTFISSRHYVNADVTIVEFYSVASAYYPDWTASVFKHVNTKTK